MPPAHPAWLEDRIAFSERRPQRYGTQFDWDRDGRMSPWLIDDVEGVEQQERVREMVARECERPPADYERRQRDIRAWPSR